MFVNISPPGVPFDANATAITQGMTIDPCNPSTIYVCVGDAEHGIYRSTGGGTWTRLDHGGGFPVRVRVDPEDPLHLYVGDGVRGGNNGFFYTLDGGVTWTLPQGFKDFADEGGSYDVYHVEPDPTDFEHVLVSFHSAWKGEPENGVIESFDGGVTWKKAGLPGAGAGDGTDVYFLYEPAQGIGNAQTWLFGTQGNGHWRTTDSGENWTKVSDISMQHGGGAKYYSAQGALYVSSAQGVLKSTDNGETFTKIGLNQAYLSVIGRRHAAVYRPALQRALRHRAREQRHRVGRIQHAGFRRGSFRDGHRSNQRHPLQRQHSGRRLRAQAAVARAAGRIARPGPGAGPI
jgi:hypothetical protein